VAGHNRFARLSVTALVILCATLGATSPASAARPWRQAVAVEAFSGDVFVVNGTGDLVAVDPRTTSDSAALFNLAGEPLGLTWGAFRAATATSTAASVISGTTDVRVTLSGLIPNGVYSLFYRTLSPDSANPVCPQVDATVAMTALGAAGPDASSFVADSSGAAAFHARVRGLLLNAQEFAFAAIYHFDSMTYGPVPNRGESVDCGSSFGIDAMRQLFVIQKSP